MKFILERERFAHQRGANDAQKVGWAADGVFGVLAFTPAAPVSTVYFVGKVMLSGSGPRPGFERVRDPYIEVQVKMDNLRVHQTIHKIPLK